MLNEVYEDDTLSMIHTFEGHKWLLDGGKKSFNVTFKIQGNVGLSFFFYISGTVMNE